MVRKEMLMILVLQCLKIDSFTTLSAMVLSTRMVLQSPKGHDDEPYETCLQLFS